MPAPGAGTAGRSGSPRGTGQYLGRYLIALVCAAGLAVAGWLVWSRETGPDTGGIVVVKASPTSQPSAVPLPPAPTSASERPPAPPARNTPPEAFVGTWTAPDGKRLAIARTAPDRYDVRIIVNGITETYDGLLQNGSMQIPRGIDGTWLQIADNAARPCVQLGRDAVFCRT